jgi:hypothetical protein
MDSSSVHCRCVFPGPGEQELATVPGADAGTAFRVYMDPGSDGFVRLQQLAFQETLGWYVQKSFLIPRETLSLLMPHLKLADCMMPKRKGKLRLTLPIDSGADRELERREA